MESWKQDLFRALPKVDEMLGWLEAEPLSAGYPRWAQLDAVRDALERRRDEVSRLADPAADPGGSRPRLTSLVLELLPARGRPRLRPLINASGIVVHTNLGRSPLAIEALEQIELVARGYSNLEYTLETGERGSRQDHCEGLLRRLTGAEAALAVNNNAAAVFLCLNTLAEGREVVVSRGQLVEIGGSFRIPDVMRKSGALLREVGATNKTKPADYRDAIGPTTALLMRVHTSNFRVVGFTAAVELPELVAIGHAAGLPVLDDLGSGCLVDLSPYGLPGEPTVQDAVAAGADLVSFSGDKLLGAPQAGLIVGRRALIDRIRANPLHRAMRIDKLTLAGLEATLRLYLEGERGVARIPTLRMIAEPVAAVRRRARRALRKLSPQTRASWGATVIPSTCQVGGGALPLEPLPSAALSLGGPDRPAHRLEEALRRAELPVVGRIQEGRLILDMRTVEEAQVALLAGAVDAASLSLGERVSHLIVGTAGHIDHGKTTLVRALTGIDTDRLKEEKERGITIELGFAHLELPGLPPVGIVDVPGHEKFVHHMVAGAAGIDLVLLVIAADEGIMPQTREHLDICRLLGVSQGIVVLTKADLVEPDWLEMVGQDVAAYLAGSFLESAPVIPVSSTSGRGIPELRAAIAAMLGRVPPRETTGIPRLPIDRVFTMRGFGTVVTGTLIAGRLGVGDAVEVLPARVESRIRGIQVYGKAVESASAGQRTAINLQGVEKSAIERGAVLTHPGLLEPTYLMDARLLYLKSAAKPLPNRTRVRLHLGTSEILARVILLGRAELAPGEEAMVQLRLESPGVALPRDRFVIRGYSPVVTLGGGELVDTRPAKHRQFSQAALEHVAIMAGSDPATTVPLLVRETGLAGAGREELARRLNLESGTMHNHLAALVKKGVLLEIPGTPPLYVHREPAELFDERALGLLKEFHGAEPLKTGLPKEELKSRFPTAAPRVFAGLLEHLAKRNKVAIEQDLVRLATHRVTLRVDQEQVKSKVEEIFRRSGLQTPALDAVAQELRLDARQLREAVGLLIASKRLVKITEEILMHEESLEPLRAKVVAYLKGGAKMGMPEFKEISGVSRKYSVPLLEYFDRSGLTIRVGDQRVLRKSAGA